MSKGDNLIRLMFSNEIVESFYQQLDIGEMTFDQLLKNQKILVKIVDKHEKDYVISQLNEQEKRK